MCIVNNPNGVVSRHVNAKQIIRIVRFKLNFSYNSYRLSCSAHFPIGAIVGVGVRSDLFLTFV